MQIKLFSVNEPLHRLQECLPPSICNAIFSAVNSIEHVATKEPDLVTQEFEHMWLCIDQLQFAGQFIMSQNLRAVLLTRKQLFYELRDSTQKLLLQQGLQL